MRRHGRRHVSEYVENEELNETYETYEDYEETDVDSENEVYDEEEAPQRKSVWVKIGKIAVIILVLIALFFISMKVTEIVLDRNSEPEYSSDIPAYTDSEQDEDIPAINDQDEQEEVQEYKEYEEQDMTPVKQPEENKKPEEKPEQTQKPAETQKPEEKPAEKPAETQKPSTEPAPSKPSKPVITPGNPAA